MLRKQESKAEIDIKGASTIFLPYPGNSTDTIRKSETGLRAKVGS